MIGEEKGMLLFGVCGRRDCTQLKALMALYVFDLSRSEPILAWSVAVEAYVAHHDPSSDTLEQDFVTSRLHEYQGPISNRYFNTRAR